MAEKTEKLTKEVLTEDKVETKVKPKAITTETSSDNLFEVDVNTTTNKKVNNNKKIIIYAVKNVELPKSDVVDRRLSWYKDKTTNKFNSNEVTFDELAYLMLKYSRAFDNGSLFVIDKEVLELYPELKEKAEIIKDISIDIKWLEDNNYVKNIEQFKSKLRLIPKPLYNVLISKIIAERKKDPNFFSNRILIKTLCNELNIKEDDLDEFDEVLITKAPKSSVQVLKG